jgi:hypothetical protein
LAVRAAPIEQGNFNALHKMLGVAAADPQGMVGEEIPEQCGTKWKFLLTCNPRPF